MIGYNGYFSKTKESKNLTLEKLVVKWKHDSLFFWVERFLIISESKFIILF